MFDTAQDIDVQQKKDDLGGQLRVITENLTGYNLYSFLALIESEFERANNVEELKSVINTHKESLDIIAAFCPLQREIGSPVSPAYLEFQQACENINKLSNQDDPTPQKAILETCILRLRTVNHTDFLAEKVLIVLDYLKNPHVFNFLQEQAQVENFDLLMLIKMVNVNSVDMRKIFLDLSTLLKKERKDLSSLHPILIRILLRDRIDIPLALLDDLNEDYRLLKNSYFEIYEHAQLQSKEVLKEVENKNNRSPEEQKTFEAKKQSESQRLSDFLSKLDIVMLKWKEARKNFNKYLAAIDKSKFIEYSKIKEINRLRTIVNKDRKEMRELIIKLDQSLMNGLEKFIDKVAIIIGAIIGALSLGTISFAGGSALGAALGLPTIPFSGPVGPAITTSAMGLSLGGIGLVSGAAGGGYLGHYLACKAIFYFKHKRALSENSNSKSEIDNNSNHKKSIYETAGLFSVAMNKYISKTKEVVNKKEKENESLQTEFTWLDKVRRVFQ